jgi:hypothetical protein
MSKQSIIRPVTALAMLVAAVLGLTGCASDQASSGSGTSRDGMGQQVDPKTGTPLPGTAHMGY